MISNNLTSKLNEQTAVKDPNDKKFSVFLTKKKQSVEDMLGKDGATRFISSIIAAVSTNPALNECSHSSLLSGALLGESLKLAHSPQLGQYYLVPFTKKDKNGNVTETNAQFILGVKGMKQLAMRSGQYLKMNALPIVQGEYKGLDAMTGEPIIKFITDADKRAELPVIGYYAYYKLVNGYSQSLYWTKNYALAHADRYSQAFSWHGINTDKMKKVSYEDYLAGKYPKADEWKYSSFWYKDFDAMACGKIMKKLLSDGAPLSIEMQQAIVADEKVVEMDGEEEFVYGDTTIAETPANIDTTTGEVIDDKQTEEKEKKPSKGKSKAETNTQTDINDMFFER